MTIDGSKVIIHHSDDKEPQPLALHHIPICVTFAIFEASYPHESLPLRYVGLALPRECVVIAHCSIAWVCLCVLSLPSQHGEHGGARRSWNVHHLAGNTRYAGLQEVMVPLCSLAACAPWTSARRGGSRYPRKRLSSPPSLFKNVETLWSSSLLQIRRWNSPSRWGRGEGIPTSTVGPADRVINGTCAS